MNFLEALDAHHQGKRVRRASWVSRHHDLGDPSPMSTCYWGDLIANDWVVGTEFRKGSWLWEAKPEPIKSQRDRENRLYNELLLHESIQTALSKDQESKQTQPDSEWKSGWPPEDELPSKFQFKFENGDILVYALQKGMIWIQDASNRIVGWRALKEEKADEPVKKESKWIAWPPSLDIEESFVFVMTEDKNGWKETGLAVCVSPGKWVWAESGYSLQGALKWQPVVFPEGNG